MKAMSKNALELIHVDIWGQTHLLDLKKPKKPNRYLMSFLDNYNKKCWVYFMRNKNESSPSSYFLGTRVEAWSSATLVPWLGLSESDSKLYTNFEFCEGKNHEHFKTCSSTKPTIYVI